VKNLKKINKNKTKIPLEILEYFVLMMYDNVLVEFVILHSSKFLTLFPLIVLPILNRKQFLVPTQLFNKNLRI